MFATLSMSAMWLWLTERVKHMLSEYNKFQRAGAAGWAFLVWLFGGGLGLAILVFIVLKALGG